MVDIPEKSPDWKSIIKNDFQSIFKFFNSPEIQALIEKTDHHYYYWDKVRSQPLPKKYNKEEIWAVLRFRRQMNSSPTPINDVNGKPFTFWLPDDLQKHLHLIDQSTGGGLVTLDPTNDKKASARYMVSSLMEEAITSSQIEGAATTIKEAKKMLIEKRKPKNKSEQMIYNNYITMQAVKELCHKELTLELLLNLHQSITHNTLETVEEAGRFRTAADDVSVVTTYGEVLFVPPKAGEIPERLQAMTDFANHVADKPFIHPVVKAIMLHFWMAYIHPFTDGNGRMARTLFYWYMLKHGYWLFEYTSISKIILQRTTRYANAYLHSEHDCNDLTYFIHFHIEIIMLAIDELKQHIKNEREKSRQLRNQILDHPNLNTRQTRILNHLMSNQNDVLTIKGHQSLNKLSYQTARNDLLDLEEKQWVKSLKKGKTFYFIPVDHFWEKFEKSHRET